MVNDAEKQKAVVLSRDTSEAVSNLLLLDVVHLFLGQDILGQIDTFARHQQGQAEQREV